MNTKKKFRVALVGTDSLRGKEIKSVLSVKRFPIERIEFFDPDVQEEYSKLTEFQGEPKVIHHPEKDSLERADLVFLAADKKTNQECASLAFQQKFQAIDLSETFNEQEEIPVVVAGVNDEILGRERFPVIANPHPVTIILSHLFHLVLPKFGILKTISFVLQPVSAFDESGIEELASQSAALLGSTSISKKVFRDQIAFNILSHTERPDKNGFSSAEKQIMSEIKRVLRRQDFAFSLSIIQAPVFHTYSIMTYLELEKETGVEDLECLFKTSPFFKLSVAGSSCSVSALSVAGKENIFIGMIKKEEAIPRSFWIWTVADNLTLGSALNAYEIAKILLSSSQA